MDLLKMIWPFPFKVKESDVTSLVVNLVIFLVIMLVFGALIGLLAKIAIIGTIFAIIGSLAEIYGLVGIILCVLKFLGMAK